MFSEWYGHGFDLLLRLFQGHQLSSRFLIWICLRWGKAVFINLDVLKVTATVKKLQIIGTEILQVECRVSFLWKFEWKNSDNCEKMIICKTGIFTKFSVFTWCHCGHVGEQNNSEKSLLGIWFYYYAKLEWHFAIVLYTNMAVLLREWKQRICMADLLIHLKKIY